RESCCRCGWRSPRRLAGAHGSRAHIGPPGGPHARRAICTLRRCAPGLLSARRLLPSPAPRNARPNTHGDRMRVRNTLAAGCTLATLIAAHAAGLDYPASPKQPVSDTFHGVTVSEDYRWLENTEDPKVVAWVAAQNALTRKVIDALPQRESIKKELQGMVEGGRISRGSFTFAGHKLFALKRQPPKNQAMVVVLSA